MENIDLYLFSGFLPEIDDVCRGYLYRLLGVNGNCPRCGAELGKKPQATLMRGARTFCKSCPWKGNARDRTVMQNAKLSDAQAIFLFAFVSVDADRHMAAMLLGIDPVTYDVWKTRLQPLLQPLKVTHI